MADLFQDSLRNVAKKKGYNVGVENGIVSVTNPTTGKAISFQSGQGKEYGLTGLNSGYNIVGDVSLLDKALAADDTPTPFDSATSNSGATKKGTGTMFDLFGNNSQYNSQWSDDIQSAIDKINNWQPFDYASYDPNKDAAFTAFRDNAIEQGNKAYRSNIAATAIPGVASTSIGTKIAQHAKDAYIDDIQNQLPYFMNQARADHNTGLENLYRKAGLFMDVDNTGYNRYADDRDYDLKEKEFWTNETGYIPFDATSIPADHPLRQYSDNYAAEINRRKAIDPNDPTIPVLEALRYQKVNSDPTLKQKYGNSTFMPMGIKSQDLINTEWERNRITENDKFEKDMANKEYDLKVDEYNLARSKANSAATNKNTLGAFMIGMEESGDPVGFVNALAGEGALTDAEYKYLSEAAKELMNDPEYAYSHSSTENQSNYQLMKNILIDGYRPGLDVYTEEPSSFGKIFGAKPKTTIKYNEYKDNPEEALKQLMSKADSNKELLGPLYNTLKSELVTAIANKPEIKDKEGLSDDEWNQYLNIMLSDDPASAIRQPGVSKNVFDKVLKDFGNFTRLEDY